MDAMEALTVAHREAVREPPTSTDLKLLQTIADHVNSGVGDSAWAELGMLAGILFVASRLLYGQEGD